MNQKFFASLTVKYLRVVALLFVLFGAAQQLSAQSLVTPTVAYTRLKGQTELVKTQVYDFSGTETQRGLMNLRLEYYNYAKSLLLGNNISTQDALNKSAVLLAENFSKLPDTNITLTAAHVETIQSETTTLLSN